MMTDTAPAFSFDAQAGEWWPPQKGLAFLKAQNPYRFEYFDRFVPSWGGQRALDVGCGGGYTCEFLARRGALVSGVDLSEASLDAARRHARSEGLTIDYRACTTTEIPHDDGSFPVVTCLDVLEHVEDLRAVLNEIFRVLAPGGRLLFDTINQTPLSKLLVLRLGEDLLGLLPKGNHSWEGFIPPPRLVEGLVEAGFSEAVELAGVSLTLPRLKPRIGPRGSTAVLYYGVATKPAAPQEKSGAR